ncbi:MAG: hypothetical protein Q9171_002028 [Xanthocarpia ochracea]
MSISFLVSKVLAASSASRGESAPGEGLHTCDTKSEARFSTFRIRSLRRKCDGLSLWLSEDACPWRMWEALSDVFFYRPSAPSRKVDPSFDANRGHSIGYGDRSIVFAITSDIVVKTAIKNNSPPPGYKQDEVHSKQLIKNERAVFDILVERKNWDPNIIFSFLHTPGYIFMERAYENLFQHVTQTSSNSLCGLGDIVSDL